mgnify:CR=1 FL=1
MGELLHCDEVIVLLATLDEQVLAVDEIFGRDGLVEGGKFLLVQAHAITLDHLSHLALAGEDVPTVLAEQVDGFLSELILAEFVVRHILEDIHERSLVELSELVFGSLAEEDVAGSDSHVEILFGVYHRGDLSGESFLQYTAAGILTVLGDERIDCLLIEVGEDLDIAFGIFVADVEPELIESVWCGAVSVKPDVAALGLSELLAVGFGDERAGEAESLGIVAEGAADELCTGCHVAPLVVTAKLQAHTIVLVLIEEVVALEQLIGKLSEGQAVAGLSVEALLHAVLGHHIVHGDVLANVAHEVEELIVLHPVVVVDQLSLVGLIAVEVEELADLLLDGLLIVIERVLVEEVALLALAGRIADHTRGTADEQIRLMSAALQVTQHHDAAKVSDMQRVGSRVGTQICRNEMSIEILFSARHDLGEHAAPFQFFYEVFHFYMFKGSKSR